MFKFSDSFDNLQSDAVTLEICEKNKGDDAILPFYYYSILNPQGDMVGKISIRIGDNFHSYYNGHIGYEIFESYRGHYYSYEAAKLVIQVAKAHQMERIYITCSRSNAASIKIIERLGAVKVEVAKIPPEYIFYYDEIEDHCIYSLPLTSS